MDALGRKPSATLTLHDVGLLLVRVMPGLVFLFHGSQKLFGAFGGPGLSNMATMLGHQGFPVPMVSAILAACAEFFGGLCLLAGIAVRLTILPTIFVMVVAVTVVHRRAFDLGKGGMEYALTLAVVMVSTILLGPGPLTLPALLRRLAGNADKGSTSPG